MFHSCHTFYVNIDISFHFEMLVVNLSELQMRGGRSLRHIIVHRVYHYLICISLCACHIQVTQKSDVAASQSGEGHRKGEEECPFL